jgi:hypothetical protein
MVEKNADSEFTRMLDELLRAHEKKLLIERTKRGLEQKKKLKNSRKKS